MTPKDFQWLMTAKDAPKTRRFGRIFVPMHLYWRSVVRRCIGEIAVTSIHHDNENDRVVVVGWHHSCRDLASTEAVPDYQVDVRQSTGQAIFTEVGG